MSTNEIATRGANTGAPVAKDAPTEQQASQAGAPKRFERGQTVCNEKNDKGKLCNGHLKQVSPVGEEARQHMRGDDLLYRCQTCGTLYMGPPLGHVRDPRKQARYVQSELVAILEAAGGTLPAFKKNETGAWVPVSEPAHHAAPAAAATSAKPAAAKPAPSATPAAATPPATGDETPEQKRARIIAEAKAKAAARMAGGTPARSDAAPAASAAAPASPAPAASATPGDAPAVESAEERRARIMAEAKAKAAARMATAKGGANTQTEPTAQAVAPAAPPSPAVAPSSPATPAMSGDAPADETPEQKRARQMAEIKAKAAARMAAKGGMRAGGETSIATPPTTPQPPAPTSGTDSSAAADAHRPAAEAQAATGQASAAPLSPAAATASPAAGAETPADLAPDASIELTPGAPRDERADASGATE